MMRSAEQIVAILLEGGRKSTTIAFGPGYSREGYLFDEVQEWKKRLQSLVRKRRQTGPWYNRRTAQPTVADVMAEMLERGYSFVRKGSSGSVEVLTPKGESQIVTNDRGVANLENAFGIKPESMVIHRQGVRGKKITARLGDIIKGWQMPEPEEDEGEEQLPRRLRGKGAAASSYPEADAPHPMGGPNPDPNVLQPYPIDVYLGLTVDQSPTGLVVTKVDDGSPAARSGWMVNDVITGIERYKPKTDRYGDVDPQHPGFGPHAIQTKKEFQAVAGNFVDGRTYVLRVLRGDGERRLTLRPEHKPTTSGGPEVHIPGSEIK